MYTPTATYVSKQILGFNIYLIILAIYMYLLFYTSITMYCRQTVCEITEILEPGRSAALKK